MNPKDKTIIITGAGTGIGQACAVALAREGANVVCTGRRIEKLQETMSLIEQAGGQALAVSCDVTKKDQVDAMARQTLEKFGSIDILFNNAGSFQAVGPLWENDPDVWWRDVEINLLGSMLCIQAVLPHMREKNSGIIINMTGGGAKKAIGGSTGYATSKTAVLRLTDTLAAELEQTGSAVLVFAIDPGLIKTAMTENLAVLDPDATWLAAVKNLHNEDNSKPEDTAKGLLELIHNAKPSLNGRVFQPKRNIAAVAQYADELQEKDLLKLTFKDFWVPKN